MRGSDSSRPSFNLVDGKFIGAIFMDGTHEKVSISELFTRGDEIIDLYGDDASIPVAMYSLVGAIVRRAAGKLLVVDEDFNFKEARKKLPPLCLSYLDKWKHRFDLFDPTNPFMQAPGLAGVEGLKKSSSACLCLTKSTGHNKLTSDVSLEDEPKALSPAEAAAGLISIQAFTVRTIPGGSDQFGASNSLAPHCVLAIILGKDMLDTMLINALDFGGFEDSGDDLPPWERQPLPPIGACVAKDGFVRNLTLQSRRVLLVPESDGGVRRVFLQTGEKPQKSSDHPYWALGCTIEDEGGKQKVYKLRPDYERHPFLNADSLLSTTNGPAALRGMLRNDHRFPDLKGMGLRIRTFGMITKKASIMQFSEQYLPFRLCKHKDAERCIKTACSMSREKGRLLDNALFGFYLESRGTPGEEDAKRDKKELEAARVAAGIGAKAYWDMAGEAFYEVLDRFYRPDSNDEEETEGFRASLNRAVASAFDLAVGEGYSTSRGIRAIAMARGRLFGFGGDEKEDSMASSLSEAVVGRLYSLKRSNPGALARLRESSGRPHEVAAAISVLQDAMADAAPSKSRYRAACCGVVAGLFALDKTDKGCHGSFASSLRLAGGQSVDDRIANLLGSSENEILDRIRPDVRYVLAKDEPINWRRLLDDLIAWNDSRPGKGRSRVQSQWAEDYYLVAKGGEEEEGESK